MNEQSLLDDYAAARRRFLALAQEKGARIESHVNAGLKGKAGEELATDIAWFGREDAERVFLCTSGMHGLEGPVGSAIEAAWLSEGGPGRLPANVAVCLVHALNAWGFSHFARCTENNVDLNRNWADFSKELPVNAEYTHIRDMIRLKRVDEPAIAGLIADYERLKRELGPGRLSLAVTQGQYEDPRGLQFGGRAPEFGVRVFCAHVLPRLQGAREVGLLDWHTGVGDFGEVAFLVTGGIDSEAGRRAAAWWGEARVRGWRRSPTEEEVERDVAANSLARKKFGQLYHRLPELLPNARVAGGIIEFGTERPGSFERLMLATMYELWLRFEHRGDRFAPEHAVHLATMREAFVPSDAGWRSKVLDEGPRLMQQVIDGLSKG
ncbi:MAG: DUF2817 domain-containing protein [Alphaproteobacteria bacterium]|nr:DUF2817 domain-containing protein [Alphaproteobacteria bacterium]